jgi:hypothetical protein
VDATRIDLGAALSTSLDVRAEKLDRIDHLHKAIDTRPRS